ncbi:MAG: lysophospholipid acyltransferase family protein [Caldilineaceae bacterium]
MAKFLRTFIFLFILQPLVRVILGLRVENGQALPTQGPAIIAANHNSHIDTMVLMALFPLRCLPKLRPVAAADYWMSNRWITWFSRKIVRIVPINREGTEKGVDPLEASYAALAEGSILIFFPEGSRGEPEKLSDFKPGITLLAERFPEAPVIPVYLYGLGKVWPKGAGLVVPFFCHVLVGEPMYWEGQRLGFMRRFKASMKQLAAQGDFPVWQ